MNTNAPGIRSRKAQRGASAIVVLLVLAVLGLGVFFALQLVPPDMGSSQVEPILESVQRGYDEAPVSSVREVQELISRRLDINEMQDLRDAFTVKRKDRGFEITVSYERTLDLIYEQRPMPYHKTLVLTP